MDILAHLGLDPQNSDVHVGFDGGQDILKLALTVTEWKDLAETGRAHYSEVCSLYSVQLNGDEFKIYYISHVGQKIKQIKVLCY